MKQEKTFALPSLQSPSIGGLLRDILVDSANAWQLPRVAVSIIMLIPAGIVLIGFISALLGKGVFRWFTREDGPVENLAILSYTLAMVFCVLLVRQLWVTGNKWIAVLYIGLGLGFIFMIGEDLSWGQRIFGWQTGEALQEINRQGETNLHNIYGVEEMFRWAQLLIGAYGTFLPLVLLLPSFPDRYLEPASRIIPHYSLIPYFFILFAWRVIHNILGLTKSHPYAANEFSEFIELILAIGFFLFIVYQVRRFYQR